MKGERPYKGKNRKEIKEQILKKQAEIKYEDFYEILLYRDTCHLLEVNPSIFIATQYEYGGNFQVYENKGESFPLIGELNLKSIGYSTNCLCKINDKWMAIKDSKVAPINSNIVNKNAHFLFYKRSDL